MMKLKNNKGFTLVELVVSIAILGIIITPLSSLFISTIKNNVRAEDKLIANQLAQEYMEQVMADILKVIDSTDGPYTKTESNSGMDITITIDKQGNTENIDGSINQDITFESPIDVSSSNYNDNDTIQIDPSTIKIGPDVAHLKLHSNIQNTNTADAIHIKINCKAVKTFKVSNRSGRVVKFYKIYSKDTQEKVTIKTIKGEVMVYENIFDQTITHVNEKLPAIHRNDMYKINVTVKKDNEPLVTLVSFKTIKID